jgi:hypothetical protein
MSGGKQIDDLLDGFVGAVICGFQFTVWLVTGDRAMVEAAVGGGPRDRLGIGLLPVGEPAGVAVEGAQEFDLRHSLKGSDVAIDLLPRRWHLLAEWAVLSSGRCDA